MAFIHGWAGQKEFPPTNYVSGKELSDEKIYEVAKELVEAGWNIMIYHSGCTFILFVDDQRFQQR